jgi:hypothetical protein
MTNQTKYKIKAVWRRDVAEPRYMYRVYVKKRWWGWEELNTIYYALTREEAEKIIENHKVKP